MWAGLVVMFVLGMPQPVFDGMKFDSKAECEAALPKVKQIIAEHNASADNPAKITHYAVACMKVEKAPQGQDA